MSDETVRLAYTRERADELMQALDESRGELMLLAQARLDAGAVGEQERYSKLAGELVRLRHDLLHASGD